MSGVVTSTLSDKELGRLIAWGEWVASTDAPLFPDEEALLSKLRAWEDSVSCKPCQAVRVGWLSNGEPMPPAQCPILDADPNAP